MNARISGHSDYKRHLRVSVSPALGENDADPRPGETMPGDKNNILHVDTTAQVVSDLETVVNILDYPFAEITKSVGLLMVCRERKRQQGALLPGT